MRKALILAVLLPCLAAAQSFPVYWDVGQGSYRWSSTLVDFATEAWVLMQDYIDSNAASNMIAEALSGIETLPQRESLWYIDSDGLLAPKSEPIDWGDHWQLDPLNWGMMITTTNLSADVLWTVDDDGNLTPNW